MRPLTRRLSRAGTLLAIVALALTARQTQASIAAGKIFQNPVYAHDFPDPFILRSGSTYYAYATQDVAARENIQRLTSRDLIHWKLVKDAMPVLARWAGGNVWAPELFRRPDRKYALYYTAQSVSAGHQCIGLAIGPSPGGHFADRSSKPFICQSREGGSIDPSPFRDSNGQMYLLWKNDGNCCGKTDYLYIQRMSADGTKLLGKPVRLNKNDDPWEGSVVEGPEMVKHGSEYFLFYSANAYNTAKYAVGYATCTHPLGPCTDSPDNPILHSDSCAAGPGGENIFTDAKGHQWVAYHAWPPGTVGPGAGGPGRQLWIDRLAWIDGKPTIHGPTCGAQPAP